jgi:hypothetical protein
LILGLWTVRAEAQFYSGGAADLSVQLARAADHGDRFSR